MFQKWELVSEGQRMLQHTVNPIMGLVSRGFVIVDVYRKKKMNGMYKYKNVVRK
jgi:hypothetical protein